MSSSGSTPRSDLSGPHADPGVLGEQWLRGGVWVVVVCGDIDHSSHVPLLRALETAAASHPVVVLDATAVTFGDSTFLNLLLRIHRQTVLRIAGLPDQMVRLLEMTGTDQVLHLYSDLDTAVEA